MGVDRRGRRRSSSRMGRSESGEDLRSKLDKKKDNVEKSRRKYDTEDSNSFTEASRRSTKKGKENEKALRAREADVEVRRKVRKYSRSRSYSRDRKRGPRHRSRSRSSRAHKFSRSSRSHSRGGGGSVSRKPLSVHVSDKSYKTTKVVRDGRSRSRSRNWSKTKRNLSPSTVSETPIKAKHRKESSQSPISANEKVEKKKKKSKLTPEEKAAKKKKKKTKEKKEKKDSEKKE